MMLGDEKTQSAVREEVGRLLEQSLRGELTDGEIAQLESLVRNNPVARRHAAEYLAVSQSLRSWAHAMEGLDPALSSEVNASNNVIEEKVERAAIHSEIMRRPRMISMTVATIVLSMVVVGLALVAPPVYRAVTQRSPKTAAPVYVAVLTDVFEAEWAHGQIGAHRKAQLVAGHELNLLKGFAEVTFHSGARVLLEGPVSLRLERMDEATLHEGRIVARIANAKSSFVVNTKYRRVVDLGTEFGVEATKRGDVNVHVLEGRVAICEVDENLATAPARIEVSAGEAVRIRREDASTVVSNIAYDSARFTRESPGKNDEWHSESPLPVTSGLALWLSADYGVAKDTNGRVILWKDRLTGDNRLPHNAIQANAKRRPVFVDKAIGGKPGLSFDGRSMNIVTSIRVPTAEQTIVAVFQPTAISDRFSGGQILNTSFPPNFVLEVTPQGSMNARVYDGRSVTSVVTNSPLQRETPIIATYVFDPNQNSSRLLIDGEIAATGIAPPTIMDRARTVIGSHPSQSVFFCGMIGEIICFDKALTADELARVHAYLSEKYSSR